MVPHITDQNVKNANSFSVNGSSYPINAIPFSPILDPFFLTLEQKLQCIREKSNSFEDQAISLQTFGENSSSERQTRLFANSQFLSNCKESSPLPIRQKQTAIQTENQDENVFPPFDHRVCLRCKLNDLKSPGFCKYSSIGKLNGSQEMRVHRTHIYGVNIEWRTQRKFCKDQPLPQDKTYEENSVNTILSFRV
eukprot:TRINITY_DN1138_c0_g2_i2.p1 TRINITY_DN1138_c0_g2~~TRINITY_DN1138_c0_g2_i2.p1  ORF type:complete len:194 (-),score=24.56 TRINITY_DN1138_c0_g2_i2:89-670(-)